MGRIMLGQAWHCPFPKPLLPVKGGRTSLSTTQAHRGPMAWKCQRW